MSIFQSKPAYSAGSALYIFVSVTLEQFLSKANNSEIPELLLTLQHSSTNPPASEAGANGLLNGVLQSVRGH